MTKKALITGVTGQDGAYLARLLLEKGYDVYGLKRRSSSLNTTRIDSIYVDPHYKTNFHLRYGDLTDSANLIKLVSDIEPDEVYNLGAMSHVRLSFEMPEFTANVNGLGTARLLDAIRICGFEKITKFYQASTSEMFGNATESPQKESTPFCPRSPYGIAKLYAYWMTINYRQAYGMFAANGILFNHESPMRGETFVTRKVAKAVAAISKGRQQKIFLGNLEAKRDWGYTPEFVEGMWRILQHKVPEDFILATGKTTSVRELVEKAFACVDINIDWQGEPGSIDEKGLCKKTGEIRVQIDPSYFRPTEVDCLIGDYSKAKTHLNWEPKKTIEQIIEEMVTVEIESLEAQSAF